MSQDHFNSLAEEIENRLHALKNYQFVMFTHILKNGVSNKSEICQSLARHNGNKDPKTFNNCPVFKVLIGKKFVQEYQDGEIEQEKQYGLHPRIALTPTEKLDLIKVLQKARREFENK